MSRSFYHPTREQLELFEKPWICSYSGGKDSTTLVTWMEWLRRAGWISCEKPRLVMSDTGVEFPMLGAISANLMATLANSGWGCEVVVPPVADRLYPQIFGRGLTPVHPGIRNMRWCTRATKIKPMNGFVTTLGYGITTMSGVRWGESSTRDDKLLRGGCRPGGECGVPSPGIGKYAAIVNWTDCQVFDWLSEKVLRDVRDGMADVFEVTKQLVALYEVSLGPAGFGHAPQEVHMSRFGCLGCPAISAVTAVKQAEDRLERRSFMGEIYGIWETLRMKYNRCVKVNKKGKRIVGPLKMAVRQKYYPKLLEIQEKSGLVFVKPDEDAFIRECWANKVYPKGWSVEDEKTQ